MATEADTHNRINLTALKRRDPYISNILDSATHVAVYTFNPTSGEWERTDIEGTLFVYSRLAPPMAGFTIMNQLSMDNLTEPLSSSHEFQNQRPFLLYKNAKKQPTSWSSGNVFVSGCKLIARFSIIHVLQPYIPDMNFVEVQIYGIWFYDMYDCSRIGTLLADICNKLDVMNHTTSNDAPQLNSPTSSSSSSALSLLDANIDEDVTLTSSNVEDVVLSSSGTNPVDIMQILSKAKKEYDKVNVPKKDGGRKLQNKISKAELFKPVSTESDSKKVNVATLFEQSDSKKTGKNNRPLSANTFDAGSESEKKISSTSALQQKSTDRHQRFGSRSLSLSISNEQFQNNLPNVVNGAISVEELESPVMGMPAQRMRCYSVNENNIQASAVPRLPITESSGPIHKLFGRIDNVKHNNPTFTTFTDTFTSTTKKNTSISNFAPTNENQLNSYFQRSISMPMSREKTEPIMMASNITPHCVPTSSVTSSSIMTSNTTPSSVLPNLYPASRNTSLTSLMSVFPSTMPTLHEHVNPRTSLMKSISLTSGMSRNLQTSAARNPSFPVAANLHGIASKDKEQPKLLSPTALHVTKSTSQTISALASTFTSLSTTTSTLSNVLENTQSSGDPKTLISPEDFEHSSATPQKAMQLHKRLLPVSQQPDNVQPLDKTQLATTLIYLLQNDSAFIDSIHKAYVNNFSRK